MKYCWLIFCFIVLTACSVQKRKYQKGFYVDWKKNSSQPAVVKQSGKPLPESETAQQEVASQSRQSSDDAVATGNTQIPENILKKPNLLLAECDDLIFKDGTEMKVRVIEINPYEVKYRKCDFPEGPVYSSKRADLFMIRYANGTKEVFSSAPPGAPAQYPTRILPPETHPYAIAALVCGLVGIWPLTGLASIAAIVFGSIALREIRANPRLYKGEGMAHAGRVLGIVVLALVLVFVLFMLALLFYFI
jgi:hypothetical protein